MPSVDKCALCGETSDSEVYNCRRPDCPYPAGLTSASKVETSVMTPDEHQARHKLLHEHLDELIADYIAHTKKTLTKTTLMDFLKWSHTQTIKPTVRPGESPFITH